MQVVAPLAETQQGFCIAGREGDVHRSPRFGMGFIEDRVHKPSTGVRAVMAGHDMQRRSQPGPVRFQLSLADDSALVFEFDVLMRHRRLQCCWVRGQPDPRPTLHVTVGVAAPPREVLDGMQSSLPANRDDQAQRPTQSGAVTRTVLL